MPDPGKRSRNPVSVSRIASSCPSFFCQSASWFIARAIWPGSCCFWAVMPNKVPSAVAKSCRDSIWMVALSICPSKSPGNFSSSSSISSIASFAFPERHFASTTEYNGLGSTSSPPPINELIALPPRRSIAGPTQSNPSKNAGAITRIRPSSPMLKQPMIKTIINPLAPSLRINGPI